MTTEEKLRKVLSPDNRRYDHGLKLADRVECADGLKMSVQASSTHYCGPRDNYGDWYEVEVGFPTEKVDDFMQWAENPETPTDTVYGWVPVSVVVKVIDDHGGFASADQQKGGDLVKSRRHHSRNGWRVTCRKIKTISKGPMR